jgi:hypothetical protein
MSFDPKVINALAWLREGWDGDNSERAIQAFNELDNAGVFAALDEQTGYASAVEILAESARDDVTKARQGMVAEGIRTGYAAVSRPGKLERVPGTDTLRPARQTAKCGSCGLRVADGSAYHETCRPLGQ